MALAFAAGAAQAGAQVTTFGGADNLTAVPGVNALGARTAFLAATGGTVGITFESILPAGVTRSGGTLKTTPACLPHLCGANTTPGGAVFLELFGGTATFTFATPISYFGGFFAGVQLPNFIRFTDGAGAQVMEIPFPPNGAGVAFAGFTSASGGITSVTIDATRDIISADDLIFGAAATSVPEPSTWALLATGLVSLGAVARRRSRG